MSEEQSLSEIVAAEFDAVMEEMDSAPQGDLDQPKEEQTDDTAPEEEAAEPNAPEDSAGTESDQGDESEGEAAEEEPQPLAPSDRWTAEEKEEFTKLPRQAQEILLRREQNVSSYLTQESQKIADQRREIEPVLNIFKQREQVAAQNGMTPQQEFGVLYRISEFAAKDPNEYIKWFAHQRGIDLEQLVLGGESSVDPEVAELKQKVGSLEQTITRQHQGAEQAELQKLQATVDTFSSNSEQYPHFKQLETEIIAFIPLAKQSNPGATPDVWLKDAYERAAWANPSIREDLMKSQEATKAEEARKAQKEVVDKAKKAAAVNVKKRTSEGEMRKSIPDDAPTSTTIAALFEEEYERMQAS